MKEQIEIIKTGTRQQVVEAQKQIQKFWHGILHPLSAKEKKAYEVFLEEIERFDDIEDIEHQAHFINTLKWPFLVSGDQHFRFFADFVLKCIQHPSGKIRQAILHATDWLTMGTDIEPPEYASREFTAQELEMIKRNKQLYFEFVHEIDHLLDKYNEPRFRKYKYIASIPSSVYKSLQYLMTHRLLRTEKYAKMYQDFLRERHPDYLIEDRRPIIERTREIEQALEEMLEQTGSDFSLEDIKDIIYHEEDQDDMMKVVAMFDTGQATSELSDILELVTDAWNYFPHKALGGISPAEKRSEYYQGR